MLVLLYFGYNICFKLLTFPIINQFDVSERGYKQKSKMLRMHAAIPAVIKPDPPQEVVQRVISYKLYWFASDVNIVIQYTERSQTFERYDFCNALDAKQCHWTSFRLHVCKNSRAHFRVFFVLDS